MRFKSALSALGIAMAIVVGADYVSVAATGGSFLLGRSNSASTATSLTRTTNGPTLILNSKAGQSPLKVNRKVKATNLNADFLDGKTGTDYAPASVVGQVGTLQTQAGSLQSQIGNLQAQVNELKKYGPLASAAVGYAGAILSSGTQKRNVDSVTWNAAEGRYEIDFSGFDYSSYTHTAAINVWASGVACTAAQPRVYYTSDGKLHLAFLNAGTGASMQCNFSFVVFDHA